MRIHVAHAFTGMLLLICGAGISAQNQTRQGLQCEGLLIVTETTNGKSEKTRKSGTTTLTIDYQAKQVVDSQGIRMAARITDDLIQYGGSSSQELGDEKLKTNLSIRIEGTVNRISGGLRETRTVIADVGSSANRLVTESSLEAECSPQARRF